MSLQIRSIAIYSKTGERRTVPFELGALNIVTGGSKTGKSALLDIVDYCWGRTECTIAEGDIRRSVSWFAVLFDNDGEGVLVARRNPGPAVKSSDEIYLERNVAVLPEGIEGFKKNTTEDGLRSQLSSLLGIAENLHVPKPGSARAPLESSAGHAVLFCLQAQDEIASRRLLFHRQGEEFMAQTIKDVLPYFVGAMGEDHLLKQKRLNDAKGRLRDLTNRYQEAKLLAAEGSSRSRKLVQEAQRIGLVTADAETASPEKLRELLRAATHPRALSYAAITGPTTDLTELEERRRTLRAELQELRSEGEELQRIARETSSFELEAQEQQTRLASIGLFRGPSSRNDICPVCDSHLATPVPSVEELRRSMDGLERQLGSVKRDNPRLQQRIAALEQRRTAHEDALRSVQQDIATRISDNERLRIEQDQFTEQARVAGRIGYYLENSKVLESGETYQLEIGRTRAEVVELEAALDQEAMEERLTSALNVVGEDIAVYATGLGLEHAQYRLRLDRRHLTVVADTLEGPLMLRQMGSGENWVGYHVAAHLALHKLFRNPERPRPVPGFLMLDQPSQAHYQRNADIGLIDGEDEDQLAVKAIYRLLDTQCQQLSPAFQIIVVDHVEMRDEWFQSAIRERWRDGVKLVPLAWIEP